ncbi:MAG: hypothetical protein R3E66_03310 [bacterium]
MTDLHAQLVAAIADPQTPWETRFDEFVTQIFAHQFEHNLAYQRFCKGRGVTPADIKTWRDVPAVPTDAFKAVQLTTGTKPVATFQTSGTTQGKRGRHDFQTLDVYRAAIEGPFRRFCQSEPRLTMLALTPSPGDLPDSSLSFMFGELLKSCGKPWTSGFFIAKDEDEMDFDFDGLVDALDDARGPIFLMGTAFAFIELFDTVDLAWKLPAGSRVLETGGLKGRTRRVEKDELYGLFAERFGIPETHMLSEYSMTELSSQAYTDNLLRGVSWREARFVPPPWARVEMADPVTLEPIEGDETRGLIRWYDLANVDSVMAVQTSDIGTRFADGSFVLEGRAPDAELRGCSLTVEEIAKR